MDVLQQALHKAIAILPAVMLEKLVSKKLGDQGVKFPKTLPRKVAEHILSCVFRTIVTADSGRT